MCFLNTQSSILFFFTAKLLIDDYNTYMHMCVVFLHISSSSSSCRAGSTNIPDPLSPLFPIVHCLRQVFWTTSRILT